ncbi:unnamed protein product [Linum tenue]|uniref:Nuclear matrix constituent protein 1-like protein n=1 Tax=Linum tenue TaxID=586396 RepID=A0AAV0MY61_9ROSI|nr:unnamed protein product [Linum tenue]
MSSSTPQRKAWSVWSLTPRREAQKSAGGILHQAPDSNGTPASNPGDGSRLKGKGLLFDEAASPNGLGRALDTHDLAAKISRLENELFEYSMELLLVEKKDWNAKADQLKQALADVKDALKREQATHLVSVSDAEKREENLRKALGVEKQCVLDLEKSVQEMRYENAEIKFTADSKLAEANALMSSVEERSLEVEAKLRSVDARLAEVNRKSSELERKSQEVETRESAVRRDRLSLIAEKESHEEALSKQREDLREWERKLQEEEERLSKGLRIVNQREERANENDRVSKQKEKDFEEAQKKLDEANSDLKRKEDDITSRLANLNFREKEFDATKNRLQLKEEELRALEEKLNERENLEIQKLHEEHQAILDAKSSEFELEAEQRRKSLDEELKSKVVELERKEAEVQHWEAKVAKREQALEKRLEKIKEKEKDFESKSKSLKEREKTIKSEEKNLMIEKKQLHSDEEELKNLKAELENLTAANEQQLLKIHEEKEQLQISQDERFEFVRLQSELKEETEKCRFREEVLLKEAEDLKQLKENFEREWLELDGKKAEIERELKSIGEQKEKFEKQRQLEEEKIKHERQATEDYIKREFETLELAKESFKAKMEQEQSIMSEKAQSDRNIMLNEIELLKSETENSLQKKQEETNRHLQQKERLFEEEKQREMENLNYLKDVVRREMDELKMERSRIEKDRLELAENKKHLEEQQHEIREDIDRLGDISRKLKEHREVFVKEKERFIAFVEQHKDCKNCGEVTSQFVLSDLIASQEIENANILSASRLAASGAGNCKNSEASERREAEKSHMVPRSYTVSPASWLQKCTTKIFNFSPLKRIELVRDLADVAEPSNRVDIFEDEQEISLAYGNDSLGDQRAQYDGTGEATAAMQDLSADGQSDVNSMSLQPPQEISESSGLKRGQGPNKRRVNVRRTRAVKAAAEDAKAVIGEALESNLVAEDSDILASESHQESSHADKGTQRKGKKRGRGQASQTTTIERDGNESEGHSGSTAAGKRRKRQQKASTVQAPGEARYNLRRSKLRAAVVDAKTSSDLKDNNKKEDDGVISSNDGDMSRSHADMPAGGDGENGTTRHSAVPADEVAEEHNERQGNPDVNVAMSEEVNGVAEMEMEQGYATESRRESEDRDEKEDDGDEEEESLHPGEASIGKKLWTFLTT